MWQRRKERGQQQPIREEKREQRMCHTVYMCARKSEINILSQVSLFSKYATYRCYAFVCGMHVNWFLCAVEVTPKRFNDTLKSLVSG